MLEALEIADEVASLRELSKLTNACKRIPKEIWQKEFSVHRRIALLGNCSTQLLTESLFPMLLRRALFAEIYQGSFDQWEVEMIDPSSPLSRFRPQALLLFFFVESSSQVRERVLPVITSFAQKTESRVLFVPFASEKRVLKEVVLLFSEEKSVEVVDLSPVAEYIFLTKGKAPFSRKYWEEFRFPFHPDYTLFYSRFLSHTIIGLFTSLVKLVLIDLDDTLWQGTLAEDGVGGIVLDKSAQDLQRFFLDLRDKGLLLGIVSANEEADVGKAFREREDLLLSFSDFATKRCNFSPKYKNVLAIAQELHIGLEQICFLDNDSFQRHQVRKLLPEVIVPELPSKREHFLPYLKATGLFSCGDVTKEDKQRALFYAVESQRKKARKAMVTLEEYYWHLQLEIVPEPFHLDNIKRVHQLLMRTNQFNLTTQRHSKEKLLSWMQESKNYCFTYLLSDRYGNYGRVGVVIALPVADQNLFIDTWLLSCRALGRTVERAMFAHLLEWAQARGITEIVADYLPTKKNAMVAAFLAEAGFAKVKESKEKTTYRFLTSWSPKLKNTFVKIVPG